MNSNASRLSLGDRYLRQLLQTGFSLTGALSSLVESVEKRNPWPGQEPGEVLLSMAASSIGPALRKFEEDDVERAIEMLFEVHQHFMADLKLVAEKVGRRENMGN